MKPNGEPPLQGGGATTGRSIVSFADDGAEIGVRALEQGLGVAMATPPPDWPPPPGGGVLWPSLKTAIVDAPPDRVWAAVAAHMEAILAIEPERIVHATEVQHRVHPANGGDGAALAPAPAPTPATAVSVPVPSPGPGRDPVELQSYLRGYRDAVTTVLDSIEAAFTESPAATELVDETHVTWGLQATKVPYSTRTGHGVRVALLDSGLDLSHPDFAGRVIEAVSFVAGEPVQDSHGHGTHGAGIAVGPRLATGAPRYGIAYESELFAAKVLSAAGAGTDGMVLAGIAWAVQRQCAIVCLSLGAQIRTGETPSIVLEQAARRASRQGALIVAPVGNDRGGPHGVSHPANCRSILSVAALDATARPAPFSSRGTDPDGGQVDIAAPGVNVLSSWPVPGRYRRVNGTSAAAAHVAGVAALHAEADPAARGAALGRLVTAAARRLPASSQDVGAGLVQAP